MYGKDKTQVRTRSEIAALIAAVIAMLATSGCASDTRDESLERIQRQIQTNGSTNVIVTLERPAGLTAQGGPTATNFPAQRAQIATARRQLAASVPADAIMEVHRTYDTLPSVAAKIDANALDYLLDSGLVKSIHEDKFRYTTLASAMEHVGVASTWRDGKGGAGQTVVVLDTGVQNDHEFLGGRVVDEACFSYQSDEGIFHYRSLCPNGESTQYGRGASNPMVPNCFHKGVSNCSHGTHVAGIVAGHTGGTHGAAPQANIISIQVFTKTPLCRDNQCLGAADSDILAGLDYVNSTLRHRYNISSVNMSLGDTVSHTEPCENSVFRPVIRSLLSNGIATVIASGNSYHADGVAEPGCVPEAVTVGSVNDGSFCSWGNVANEITPFSNMGSGVDLLAVGACVRSSIPGNDYAVSSGTSMATPAVAGAFAVMKAEHPTLSVAEVLQRLQSTGTRVMDQRWDRSQHSARLFQLEQAVEAPVVNEDTVSVKRALWKPGAWGNTTGTLRVEASTSAWAQGAVLTVDDHGTMQRSASDNRYTLATWMSHWQRPTHVTVTSSRGGRATLEVEIEGAAKRDDTITITKAEWFRAWTGDFYLSVVAETTGYPDANLTVTGFGTMRRGESENRYWVTMKTAANPGSITVTSSEGGRATATVRTVW